MLLEVLRERIASSGPLPFEAFMEACLYDAKHGFFATGGLRSTQSGDFLTSPEVSPWFGRVMARWVDATAPGVTVVEVGAGSGTLLASLVDHLQSAPAEVVAADVSPAARQALTGVDGIDHVVSRLEDLRTPLRGVIIANELLDNLPVALAVRHEGGWEERWVGLVGGALELVAAPVRPEVAAWADAYGGVVPHGGMVEVQLAASAWVAAAVAKLANGALLIADYGGTAEELESRRTRGTLRTYRNHHLGPDPLLAPGETDVTVDVNFTAMVAAAEGAGAQVSLVRQDDFLAEWGLREEIRALRTKERGLAHEGAAMERLQLRAEATNAETLLHPRGLGDFRILIAEVSSSSAVRPSAGTAGRGLDVKRS